MIAAFGTETGAGIPDACLLAAHPTGPVILRPLAGPNCTRASSCLSARHRPPVNGYDSSNRPGTCLLPIWQADGGSLDDQIPPPTGCPGTHPAPDADRGT